MENRKRCGNCGRYPFCKRTEGASCYCDEWIRRNCQNIISKESRRNNNEIEKM